MSELRRWSEEGANGREKRLVDAGRGDLPSGKSRARILAGLGLAAVATTTKVAAATAGTGGIGLFTKIVLGTVLVAGAGGAVAVAWPRLRPAAAEVRHTAAPASAPAVSPTAAATDDAPETGPSSVASAEEPEPEPAEKEPEPPAARARPAPLSSATLSDEVAALERARKALASASPEAALRELGRYDKRFPKRALGSEETVLRVQALLARGDNARAVALADQFTAANPHSPYARRVQELVRTARKK